MRSLVFLAALLASPAAAHASGPEPGWSPDPLALTLLVAGAAAYARGLARLWGRAGAGRGLGRSRAGFFAAGLAVSAALLVTPFEALAGRALWAHMIQHGGLMLVAAPLLALSRPGLAFLWALPPGARTGLGQLGAGPAGAVCRALTGPLGAWTVYFVVLWIWHIPALHEAALASEAIHLLQHVALFAGAMLLWTALIERPGAAALIAAFATLAHSVALSALLTVSDRPWYPAYPGAWALAGLEDQQLAGLIMWVPGCLPLVAAAMWVLLGTLRDAERRARRAAP